MGMFYVVILFFMYTFTGAVVLANVDDDEGSLLSTAEQRGDAVLLLLFWPWTTYRWLRG